MRQKKLIHNLDFQASTPGWQIAKIKITFFLTSRAIFKTVYLLPKLLM